MGATRPSVGRLGEILVKDGLITAEQLTKALEAQKKTPDEPLGSILVKQGALPEKDLAITLSKQLNIPYASRETLLEVGTKNQDVLKLVPEEFARKCNVLPIALRHHYLTVALADPDDLILLDNLRKITGHYIRPVIAAETDFVIAIDKYYGEGGLLKSAIEESYKTKEGGVSIKREASEEHLSLDNIVASAEKAPVIKLTDLLIRQAIKDRASDIHVEPFYDHVSIRFRIDGVLHLIPPPDKAMILPLISRLKIISKMDISEKRLPQDGSFRATIEDRDIDFRVSTIPTIYGEKMVLRILDKSRTTLNLETLGFDKEELALYRKTIYKPYGMVLVTGPTGSGKTTTLYSALNELRGPDKNITTIEDPVEYQMDGINQVQIKSAIGLTFAAGLRAFLRQDPDIMLVGEIRDLETAEICVKAALTGHLVFSTLHTNDAPTAISRLIDIGVEPFFVVSSLLMIVAQRLVRKLCPKCRESYHPPAGHLPAHLEVKSNAVIYRPKGCERCSKTGYLGRMAIFEIMTMSERIEQLVSQKVPLMDIRAEAKRAGMRTLEESGYKKVLTGDTSVEEVVRMTMAAG